MMPTGLLSSSVLLVGLLLTGAADLLGQAASPKYNATRARAAVLLALEESNEGPRLIALVRAIDTVPDQKFPKFASRLAPELRDHAHNLSLSLILFPRWVKLDAKAAIFAAEKVNRSRGQRTMVSQVAKLWAVHDAEAALKYAARSSDAAVRDAIGQAAAGQLSTSQPERALKLVDSLRPPQQQSAINQIFRRWAETDLPTAAKRALAMPKGQRRHGALIEIGSRMAIDDPTESIRWILALPAGGTREQTADRAIKIITESDPDLARKLLPLLPTRQGRARAQLIGSYLAVEDFASTYRWALSIPDIPVQSSVASSLFHLMKTNGFAPAGKFIAARPADPIRARVATTLASRWGYEDADAAIEWATAMKDATLRVNLVRQIVTIIAGKQPAKAALLVDEHLKQEAPTHLVSTIIRAWVPIDGKAAAAWANRLPPNQMTSDSYFELIRKLPTNQSQHVQELISQIENPAVRGATLGRWLERLAAEDPIDALKWLEHATVIKDSHYLPSSVITRAIRKDLATTQKRILAVKDRKLRLRYCRAAATAMTEQDPAAAIDWLQGLNDYDHSLSSTIHHALRRIATKNPFAAMEKALKLKPEQLRESSARILMSGWVRTDLSGAYKFAENMEDRTLAGNLMPLVSVAMAQSDPESGIRLAMKLSGNARHNALKAVLERWPDTDATRTVEWLDAQTDPALRSHMIQAMAYSLSSKAPEETARLAHTLPTGSARATTMNSAINAWSRKDPVATVRFVQQFKSRTELKKYSLRALQHAINYNPEKLTAMLDLVTDSGLQLEMLQDMGDSWLRRDAHTAATWMLQNLDAEQRISVAAQFRSLSMSKGFEAVWAFAKSLPEPQRREVTRTLSSAWVRADAKAAVKWINSLEPGPNRQEAIQNASRSLVTLDTGLASTLARQINDVGKQAFAFGTIASSSMNKPDAGLAWLNTLPQGTNRFMAVQSAMYALAQKNPARALAYTTNIANVELRSQVTVKAISGWSQREPALAMKSVLQMPEGETRTKCLVATITRWTAQDPDGAAALLDGIRPADTQQQAIKAFFDTTRYRNPRLAAEWMFRLDEETTRRYGVSLAIELLRLDREAGKAFIKKLPPKQQKEAQSRAERYRLL
jgi:hypothetical protein